VSAWRLLLLVYGIVAVLAASVLAFLRDPPFDHPAPWVTLLAERGLVLGVVLALVFAGVVLASTAVLVARFEWARSVAHELGPFALGLTGPQLVALLGLAGLAEELVFRALLAPTLGVVVSSLLFGLVHQMGGKGRWPWVFWAFLVGLGFASIYAVSGSLLGPLLAHAIINGVNVARVRRMQTPPRRPSLGGLFQTSSVTLTAKR
jgi:uncharacterized protein